MICAAHAGREAGQLFGVWQAMIKHMAGATKGEETG
jgi:hypothetical protein